MGIKLLLFILFLLALYVAVQYFLTQRLIRIGVELAEKAQIYEQSPENPQATVLVVGDSSAVGTGVDIPEHSVAGYLGADFPNVKIENLAVNGLRLKGLEETLQALPIDAHYDLLWIQIGGNDIVNRTPLPEVESTLKTVLKLAQGKADTIILFHGGNVGTAKLLPWPIRWFFKQRTWALREIYIKATEGTQIHYIDMFRRHAEDPYFLEPKKYYATDFFHPGPEGYKHWYKLVRKQVDLEALLK